MTKYIRNVKFHESSLGQNAYQTPSTKHIITYPKNVIYDQLLFALFTHNLVGTKLTNEEPKCPNVENAD